MATTLGSVSRKATQWIALVACLMSCNASFGGVVARLQTTGINGAQTFLNKNNGYQWTFTTSDTTQFDEIEGVFALKRGPTTSASAVMKLYDSTYALVGQSTLLASAATQSWVDYTFSLVLEPPKSYPFQFTTGGTKTYYLVMTSEADNTGSKTWFIKPDNLTFVVLNGTQTNKGAYDGTAAPSGNPPVQPAVPEPASIAVWGLACLGLSRVRNRFGRKNPPA